jgi:two-component system, NarL family, response regulator NreC
LFDYSVLHSGVSGDRKAVIMIKIILADDHHIVRKGLKALLSYEADFQIIGEAADGREAIELVKRLEPDVLVLDLMMPVLNGLETTVELSASGLKTAIIILSMHSNEAYIFEALRSGAKAYILKDNTSDELITAIREVYAGHSYLGTSLPEPTKLALKKKMESAGASPLEILTRREQEILQLAIRGVSNSGIADRLGISQRTVETHCTSLMHKLGVSNRTQLVHLALQRGIITPEEMLPAERKDTG